MVAEDKRSFSDGQVIAPVARVAPPEERPSMEAFREACWHEPKRCEQILVRKCGSSVASLADIGQLSSALKELGIRGRKARAKLAQKLAQLAKSCAAEKDDAHIVFGRIVRHFGKSKHEMSLLRVLQDRVKTGDDFRDLRDELEDYDADFDGSVAKSDFDAVLEDLDLGLAPDQRQLIARMFLAQGRVKYQHFLAVIDPTLSPGSSEGGAVTDRSDGSTVSGADILASSHDLLNVLDSLRDRVLFAQASGVNAREMFSHFDPGNTGIVDADTFCQGLASLGLDMTREDRAVFERILYAFRVEDETGVDYVQFLRFVAWDDPDAPLGVLGHGVAAHEDHVAFHDTAARGPFVAGHTDTRSAARRREKKKAREAAVKDHEGTFVRHSFTAAGKVRQVIVPPSKRRQHSRSATVERHRVTRHQEKANGRARTQVYDGILRTSSAKKSAAQPAAERANLSASERLLKEASKPNAVVKYLGYSAHMCNDYPRVGYHGLKGEKMQSNSILVRNFMSAEAARRDHGPRASSEEREGKVAHEEMAQTQNVLVEAEGDCESEMGHRLHAAAQEDEHATLEGVLSLICPANRPHRESSRVQESTTNRKRRATARAARCWERVLDLDNEIYTPTLALALKERLAKGQPMSGPLQHLLRAARAWSIAGDAERARELIARVRSILASLGSSKGQSSLGVPRSRAKSLRAEPDDSSESFLPSQQRLEVDKLSFDVRMVREIFTGAVRAGSTAPTVAEVAIAFAEHCEGDDGLLAGLADLLRGSSQDDDVSAESDEEEEGEDKDDENGGAKNLVAMMTAHLTRQMRKSSAASKVFWSDMVRFLRVHAEYGAGVQRVQDAFTPAELRTLRAIFVRSCKAMNADGETVAASGGDLWGGVGGMGSQGRLVNALGLDKHVEHFVVKGQVESLRRALCAYDMYSWEEFLTCVAEHASDASGRELSLWASEEEAAVALDEISQRGLLDAKSPGASSLAQRLKDLDAGLESVFELRMDTIDHLDGHASLLDVYALLGRLRGLEARSEAASLERRIGERIDQFLCSRSGRAATEDIVTRMMEADRVKKLAKNSRAGAELAARAMLRKRKDMEFREGPGFSVLRSLRKEAREHLRKARSTGEVVFGHQSAKACLALASCAHFYLNVDPEGKRSLERAADLLAIIIASLEEAHMPAGEEAVGALAEKLASLHARAKDFQDAGRLNCKAARIAEERGENSSALLRWERALRAFEHVHGATDDQLHAAGRIVDLLKTSEDVADRVDALEKQGTLLIKAQRGSEAIRAFRQAKTLTNSRKRKCALSRLIASATSSVQLWALKETKSREQSSGRLSDGGDDDGGDDDDDDDDDDDGGGGEVTGGRSGGGSDPHEADLAFLMDLDGNGR